MVSGGTDRWYLRRRQSREPWAQAGARAEVEAWKHCRRGRRGRAECRLRGTAVHAAGREHTHWLVRNADRSLVPEAFHALLMAVVHGAG